MIEGKTPWKNQEEQLISCQKAYQEYHMTTPKTPSEVRARNAYQGTTQAKSKVSKPESRWREHLEHGRKVSLKEPSSSSRPRTEEQERSEERFWRERETRTVEDRFGKRRPRVKVFEEGPE